MQKQLELKQNQVDALRDIATNTSAQISDMPRSSSPNLQRLETLICKIADLDAEIARDRVELETVRLDTTLMICQIFDPVCQRLLMLRYIEHHKWTEIMKELGYSRSRIFELHEDALCAMEKLLAEGGNDYELR